MIASTFVIIPVAMFVTTKITEPRLGVYTGKVGKLEKTTSAEKRGLLWAGIALALYTVVILLLVLPENGILRNQETGSMILGILQSLKWPTAIADSITNPITPSLAYFAIFWLVLFTVWFLLVLLLGPGGNIYLP